MAIGEALQAANNRHSERRDRMRRSRNAAANKAAVSMWVGGESGSQLTAGELQVRLGGLRADFYARHPELL
jgi:hypothetical protein